MRYLGIDYGSKRLGLAISDEEAGFAFPRGVIPNDDTAMRNIANIIEEERIQGIVVGDTLSLDGGVNRITAEAEGFVRTLEEQMDIPVHRVREAWSSAEAMRFAPPGHRHDDSAAAAIILQRFLDTRAKG